MDRPNMMQDNYPPFRCKHKDCMYTGISNRQYNPENHGCNYMGVTGKSRIAQLPDDQRDPALCPFYKRGKKVIVRRKNFGEKEA